MRRLQAWPLALLLCSHAPAEQTELEPVMMSSGRSAAATLNCSEANEPFYTKCGFERAPGGLHPGDCSLHPRCAALGFGAGRRLAPARRADDYGDCTCAP